MRYTEARLTPLAMEMLANIDEDTVDFQPNYDGKNQEPLVLPGRIPNLLINGSAGIAVGMATNMPPHNLREVAAAVFWVLDHPDAEPEEALTACMERIKGPDFPTARPDRRPRGHRGRLPDRSRLGAHARRRHRRGGLPRPGAAGLHRAALPGQPGQPGRGDRRRGQGRPAAGDQRDRRRVQRPGRPPAGHHAAPRRRRQGRAEQPLQAHPAADDVRLQHALDRRRRPADAAARRADQALREPPDRGHPAAHPVPAAQGRGARAHPARLRQGARPPRRRSSPSSATASRPTPPAAG